MIKLFHGSGYQQPELKSGYLRSGKLVKWDQTESNEWLYAIDTYDEAISLGLGSMLEKKYNLHRYQSNPNDITMSFIGKRPTREQLNLMDVYVYELAWSSNTWVRVNNKHNGINNEYKTQNIIPAEMIVSCTKIDLAKWLETKKIVIQTKPVSLNW